jgi:NCS1 family nucleobase:cation symporter-1
MGTKTIEDQEVLIVKDPSLYNEDLAPVKKEKRNWNWLNYTTVWMGMVHNIVAYETAGSLLGLGMSDCFW